MQYFSRFQRALREILRPYIQRPTKQTYLHTVYVLLGLVALVVLVRMNAPRPGTTSFIEYYDTTLADYGGNKVLFENYKQHPIIVFFWASWCPYCKAELIHLGEVKTKYGDHVQILAVNRGESLGEAKAFSDAVVLPKGVVLLLDPSDELFKQLKGYAVPETIFVNSRGEEVVHQHGPMKPEEVDQAVLQIL